jgi:hypothetical protein
MSLTPNSIPDPIEGVPSSTPVIADYGTVAPLETAPVILEKPFPAWSGWDVLAIFAFALVSIFVFVAVAVFAAHSLPAYRHLSFTDLKPYIPFAIAGQAAAYPVIFMFIFILVRTRAHERFGKAICWKWPGMAAPGFIVGGIILALVVDGLARFLPTPKSLPVDTYFSGATSAYMMAGFGITLAPLLEELFFRGLLYPLLRRWLGLFTAVMLTAAAFAAIHGAQLGYAWAPVLSIFVVGVVLTVVRIRTGSVAASFLTHTGYNLALFGLLWIATDHYRHLEKIAG